MSKNDIPVKCCRCRNQHMESARVPKASKTIRGADELCCPCCGSRSYFDMRPQVAWCWASGLIELGDALPDDRPDGGGAIEIARGPKAYLAGYLGAAARHGQGKSEGKLLVPGVPEADGQAAKADALATWLAWCGKRYSRDGVAFNRGTA